MLTLLWQICRGTDSDESDCQAKIARLHWLDSMRTSASWCLSGRSWHMEYWEVKKGHSNQVMQKAMNADLQS